MPREKKERCLVCKRKIARGTLCRECYCTKNKKRLYDTHVLD